MRNRFARILYFVGVLAALAAALGAGQNWRS